MPFLVVLLLLAGARSPQAAVQRFVHPVSARDACAQLAPAYRQQIEKAYGPCVAGVARNPKTRHLVFSHVTIAGSQASLQVAYLANGASVHERYTLVRAHGIWQITASRQL